MNWQADFIEFCGFMVILSVVAAIATSGFVVAIERSQRLMRWTRHMWTWYKAGCPTLAQLEWMDLSRERNNMDKSQRIKCLNQSIAIMDSYGENISLKLESGFYLERNDTVLAKSEEFTAQMSVHMFKEELTALENIQ